MKGSKRKRSLTVGNFFEHFDLFVDAPDAVERMRELVLQLAVRGRLVPQNPQDEPVAKAIEKLVALNSSRLTANLYAVDESIELPFKIPALWKWVRFGDLVRIRTGKLDANAAVEGGAYPFFTCSKTPSRIDAYSFDTSAVILAGNGDFNLKSYKGKFDAYQRTYVIEPLGWELGFCFWLISAQIKRITDNQRGSAIPYLRLGDIADPLVPFPPLAEQKRIVAKVDELMALCDSLEAQRKDRDAQATALARASLERFSADPSPANLEFLFHRSFAISPVDLRKAILDLAVQGKLVKQDLKEGFASSELIQILKQKQELLDVRKQKRTEPGVPVDPDIVDHVIPDTWVWVRLIDICELITDGTHQTPKYTETGRMFLSAQNVKPFRFIPQKHRYVSEEHYQKYVENRKPEKGDILLTRVGAGIGEAATIDQDLDFAIYVSLGLLRLVRGFVFPDYITLWLNSPDGTSKSSRYTYGKGVSQGNLNLSLIRNFLVPLPPLAEQKRIVAKVDELMVLVDRLESDIAASREKAKALLAAAVAELVGKA